MQIQWYPGHMTKARRAIEEDIKLVDVIVELRDARIPLSSSNPDLMKLGQGKQRILVLNKADMADEAVTEAWIRAFEKQGFFVACMDARNNRSTKSVLKALDAAAAAKKEKDLKRGIKNRPARIMVVGIPNVGKSTLINSLAGKASAKTGDKPGVTKGKQWIRLSASLELLDTPGILWPKFEDEAVGIRLALTGSINDEILQKEQLAEAAFKELEARYPGRMMEVYGLDPQPDAWAFLEALAVRQAILKKGGAPDISRAAARFLDDLRRGKLGRLSFEAPKENE